MIGKEHLGIDGDRPQSDSVVGQGRQLAGLADSTYTVDKCLEYLASVVKPFACVKPTLEG
jgi:hypothetical protein